MDDILVSIIVPVYNGEKYIKRCVDSLLSQTYKNIEIIIIDDGSQDSTYEIVKAYNDKRIILKKIQNGGVSNARNVGIDLSNGDYITFVDVDDYINDETIELLVNKAIESKVDIIRYNCYIENYDGQKKELKEFFEDNIIISSKTSKKQVLDYINLPGKSIRCYCWLLFMKNENIIKFNTNLKYLEDKLFYLQNFINHKKILLIKTPLYVYVYNENSKTKFIQNENQIINNLHEIIESNNVIIDLLRTEQYDTNLIDASCGLLMLYKLDYYCGKMNYSSCKKLYKIILKDIIFKKILLINTNNISYVKKIQLFCLKKKLFLIYFIITKLKK